LRLQKYDESAEASKTSIKFSPAFTPFYNLGLAHYATGNFQGAILAFQRSIELRKTSSWEDEYTDAYYHLGLSVAKVGNIHNEIQSLEADTGYLDVPINRFKLATFYLCAGQTKLAKNQYQLLENADPALAKELKKLMKKHGTTV
jgi:tetratricopeptide (TPR) repeat protein